MVNYTPRERQPEVPSYSVDTLETCEQFDRAGYERRFGEQPPPHTNERPDKLWFDTTEQAGNYMRISRDAAGKPSFVPMTMSKELARSVNIPGAYRWPEYVPAPTPAALEIVLGSGQKQVIPILAGRLSMEEDARALALELGGVYEVDRSSKVPPFDVKYNGDPRRIYEVVDRDGKTYNAGELLAQKYSNGVGAPGAWKRNAEGRFYWAAARQSTAQLDPLVQAIPAPCRPLHSDEEFYQEFAGLWKIRRIAAAPQSEEVRLLRLLCKTFQIAY